MPSVGWIFICLLEVAGFAGPLPGLKSVGDWKIASGKLWTFSVNLERGWRINPKGSSWLELLQEGRVIRRVELTDWVERSISLPSVFPRFRYRLRGTFYFCREARWRARTTICLVQSFDERLTPLVGGGTVAANFSLRADSIF